MTNICGDLTVAACVSAHSDKKVRKSINKSLDETSKVEEDQEEAAKQMN